MLPRMALRGAEAQRRLAMRSLKPKLHRKLALVLRRDKPLTRALRELIRAINALR